MVQGFPKWGWFGEGGEFGQNGQKLHGNYKINIWGQNSGRHWGDPLGIEGTMSLKVLHYDSIL